MRALVSRGLPRLIVVAASFVATFVLTLDAGSAAEGLRFPAPAGTDWEVIGGYNTATHEGVDPYALDLARVDRSKTGGTPVLSPISGSVGYVSDSCVSVRNDDINVLLCHVFAAAGMDRGRAVSVGERIGTVAPDGEAENNGIAHIHLQVNQRDGSRGSSGAPVALEGVYALDGVEFAASEAFNAHYLRRVTSSNSASLGLPRVDAGADQTVERDSTVTLTATSEGATEFVWSQTAGPAIALQPSGATVTFVAPSDGGVTLRFQVYANTPRGVALDSVEVRVSGESQVANVPGETRGRLLSGEVPRGGVGLILFGGGTNEELVSATGCAVEDARFFTTVDGRFVGYIPGAQVALVNAEWNQHFSEGLPANLPLLARCG